MTSLNIVHGDIKPDNILVEFDGDQLKEVLIIDFGTAFIMEQGQMPQYCLSTPEYQAPEVLKHLEKR